MRSHAHISIRPAAKTGPCTWAIVILRSERQRFGVLEEVVPLLQHPRLDALARATVGTAGHVLERPGVALLEVLLSSPCRDPRRTSVRRRSG